jgi:hypothetical protein
MSLYRDRLATFNSPAATLAVGIPATSKAAGTAGAAPDAGMDEIIDRMKCGHAGDEGVMD